jgi:hypothetical protein
MPKAAVKEYGKPLGSKDKIRLPRKIKMSLQPEIPACRRIERKARSVVVLPFDRILAMFRERCSRVSQSVTAPSIFSRV